MKIEQQGDLFQNERWITGRCWQCSRCHVIVSISDADLKDKVVTIKDDQREGTWFTVSCPTPGCNDMITGSKGTKSGSVPCPCHGTDPRGLDCTGGRYQ